MTRHQDLVEWAQADPVNAEILRRLPTLRLDQAHLVAGCVYQSVWNRQAGQPPGAKVKDYDIFYFDGTGLSCEAEDAVIRRLNLEPMRTSSAMAVSFSSGSSGVQRIGGASPSSCMPGLAPLVNRNSMSRCAIDHLGGASNAPPLRASLPASALASGQNRGALVPPGPPGLPVSVLPISAFLVLALLVRAGMVRGN